MIFAAPFPAAHAIVSEPQSFSQAQAHQVLAELAVPFEENRGQADTQVAFQARTLAGPLFVIREGALVWHLSPPRDVPSSRKSRAYPPPPAATASAPAWAVMESFVNGHSKPVGDGFSSTKVNYFQGDDRSQWRSGVPAWAQVSLGQVWDGIEIRLAARGKNVEKIFTVAPGANAQVIGVEVAGGRLNLDADGTLTVETTPVDSLPVQRAITFTAPVAWQVASDGKHQPVQVAYRLMGESMNRYGFTLGAHDSARPVVIDPLLQSTYLGGSDHDWATALVVTHDEVYVAGYTESLVFPKTIGGAQPAHGRGYNDIFVAKLGCCDLSSLTQATYLGGNGEDLAHALVVIPETAVYVAGTTSSTDFPGTLSGSLARGGGYFTTPLSPGSARI